jgi:uncharacterized protein
LTAVWQSASYALIAIAVLGAAPVSADGQTISFSSGSARLTSAIRSLAEIQQAGVVRQRWDLSCGSAALSTVLTYQHGDPTPETAIIVAILRRADPIRVKARGGFSLLDLKRFVETRGYDGKGYAGLNVAELASLGVPAIIPIRFNGYDHFVVFRDVVGEHVFLADPAYGNVTLPGHRFRALWKNGIAFIVLRHNVAASRGDLAVRREDLLIPDETVIGRMVRGAPASLRQGGF